ncbi:hypothetical protein AXG93_3205s1090 [Marchantia polymorpha subsp. ruderalis]|uniref:Uncharacterized protein n=1 Tax=Marchantia polymorpha subsp. ruderalis TaxID=1480154 RepID=A0A176WQ07_MARPO|nr:hypothetical protein AXG93_3205s1090 [Marchantia polymorpha subsp. ruderalis]
MSAERPEPDAAERKFRIKCLNSLVIALIVAVLAIGTVPFVSFPDTDRSVTSVAASAHQQKSGFDQWWAEGKRFFWGADAPCPCQQLRNLTGVVEDCCCEYETVYSLNHKVLHKLLQDIVKQPFFRYFKVKLWCDCPFWPEDGMCRLRDCSVCECPDGEFPDTHKNGHLGFDDPSCQEGKAVAAVDRTLDSRAFKGWTETDNPWTHDDERDNEDITYVNLLLNPERFTGYTGPSARRIWEAIYKENCFPDAERDTCAEARVLYRLISGLHASISTHIAADYLLDEATNSWGPSPALLHERVLQHPERVQNLYFTFLFVLRAVTKAADYLSQAEYSTGNDAEDMKTVALMKELVNNDRLRAACPLPFDEAQMWRGVDGAELKQQIQKHFRNISAVMDCVGCEKCRLWGKLQTLGLGTALKILFSVEATQPYGVYPLDLQRNEVIALINLLSRLSESLEYVHNLAPLITAEAIAKGCYTSECKPKEPVASEVSASYEEFRASSWMQGVFTVTCHGRRRGDLSHSEGCLKALDPSTGLDSTHENGVKDLRNFRL